jgi:hypothetical protein
VTQRVDQVSHRAPIGYIGSRNTTCRAADRPLGADRSRAPMSADRAHLPRVGPENSGFLPFSGTARTWSWRPSTSYAQAAGQPQHTHGSFPTGLGATPCRCAGCR